MLTVHNNFNFAGLTSQSINQSIGYQTCSTSTSVTFTCTYLYLYLEAITVLLSIYSSFRSSSASIIRVLSLIHVSIINFQPCTSSRPSMSGDAEITRRGKESSRIANGNSHPSTAKGSPVDVAESKDETSANKAESLAKDAAPVFVILVFAVALIFGGCCSNVWLLLTFWKFTVDASFRSMRSKLSSSEPSYSVSSIFP